MALRFGCAGPSRARPHAHTNTVKLFFRAHLKLPIAASGPCKAACAVSIVSSAAPTCPSSRWPCTTCCVRCTCCTMPTRCWMRCRLPRRRLSIGTRTLPTTNRCLMLSRLPRVAAMAWHVPVICSRKTCRFCSCEKNESDRDEISDSSDSSVVSRWPSSTFIDVSSPALRPLAAPAAAAATPALAPVLVFAAAFAFTAALPPPPDASPCCAPGRWAPFVLVLFKAAANTAGSRRSKLEAKNIRGTTA